MKKNKIINGIKKIAVSALALTMVFAMTACGGKDNAEGSGQGGAPITVVSREDGSGTRGAFTELMGIMVDDVDNTTPKAEISQSTSVVMTTVAGNKNAIGYISLASLDDSVKAIKVDGVEPTVENIKAGSYPVSRPFLVVTGKKTDDLTKDFINFIMSKEGQAIIEEDGCISVKEDAKAYETSSGLKGKIAVGGSTSVAPVMQKLADAYKAINPDVEIEIQQTGSGAGITSTIEGAVNLGMSSRELKDEELSKGIKGETIAMDGIAVIVNNDNPAEDLTSEQIRQIFTGEVTEW